MRERVTLGDETKDVHPAEFTILATRVYIYKRGKNSTSSHIQIPVPVRKFLGVEHKDWVEVAIRRISPEEVKRDYGIDI